MTRRHFGFAIVAIVLASLAGVALNAGDIPYPDIPQGQGDVCVEDTDFMRRNHMSLLMHQRDDTVHQGIRSERHSLKECVDCHAVRESDTSYVTAESPQHFCRSCHDYAAVRIDCFSCHASRPLQETPALPGESQ